ncbi:hypothetical protein LCGC14_0595030 [marine sediment metagenome]|uniref:Uncharacterized protein n=1 Tax=marine sediment metagenome TaxID=412755 RepID=A0A0F9RH64_9ZZZZ
MKAKNRHKPMENTMNSDSGKRVHMELSEWRDAVNRGELWMYVDKHWGESAPKGLTDLEWDQHFAAFAVAKPSNVPVKVD